MSILCDIEIPVEKKLLINPVLNWYTLLTKIRKQTIIPDEFHEKFRIHIHTYCLPIFIPEIAAMTSLDITSEFIKRDFSEKEKYFRSFYSENEIVVSKLYNFDESLNRVVSRGTYRFHKVDKKHYKTYITSIFNELITSPSIYVSGELCSPLRWFRVSSSGKFWFKTTINYNTAVVYLTREDLVESRKTKIWFGKPLEIFRVKCKLITFSKRGEVFPSDFYLFFTTDPLQAVGKIASKGEYFICFLISLNEYKTSFRSDIPAGTSVNLVDSITPFIHSYYDVVMTMFPFFVKIESLNEYVIKFEVPSDVFTKIISRFQKFSTVQNVNIINSFNEMFERLNPLVHVDTSDRHVYKVDMVNPTIIYHFIRHSVTHGSMIHKIAKEKLDECENLIKELQDPDERINLIRPTIGIGTSMRYRDTNMKRYITLFRKFNKSS